MPQESGVEEYAGFGGLGDSQPAVKGLVYYNFYLENRV